MDPTQDSLLALIDLLRPQRPELMGLLFSRTEQEFDESLEQLLQRGIDHLEKNADLFSGLTEDGITACLAAFLTMPGLRVLQEAHSNGHVDMTVETDSASSMRRRLGEAKIYNGPSYHVKGLEQLINRYSTGREGGSFLVEYVRRKGIKGLVQKIRSYMDLRKPCAQRGKCVDSDIKWAFSSNHRHSSGELFRVLHLNCNLDSTG